MIFGGKNKKVMYIKNIVLFSLSISVLYFLFAQPLRAQDFSDNPMKNSVDLKESSDISYKNDKVEINVKDPIDAMKMIKRADILEKIALEPMISFINTEGDTIVLKSLRGDFVIMYFFASWCTSCVGDIKSLSKLAEQLEFADIKDIKIILLSIDFKNSEEIRKFLSGVAVENLPWFFDLHKSSMSKLNVKSLPGAFLIDKKGRIVGKFERNLNWSSRDMMQDLMVLKDADLMRDDKKNQYPLGDDEAIMYQKSKDSNITIIN